MLELNVVQDKKAYMYAYMNIYVHVHINVFGDLLMDVSRLISNLIQKSTFKYDIGQKFKFQCKTT